MSIASNRLDACQLPRTQRGIVRVQAGFFAVFCEILDGAAVQVAHHRDVLMPYRNRLFIDADAWNYTSLFRLLTTLDGALHEMPRLVPTELQQPSVAEHVRFQERVDRMPLEGESEPRSRQRPRNHRLPRTVLQTVNTRNARVQPSDAIAMIEVPPTPRRNMVIDRQRHLALRACKHGTRSMLQPDIDFLLLRGKRNPTYLPGPVQAQQPGKEFDVAHWWIPP
jgi:hypothetical protein